ncbi:MAG TPA: hypothetical protein PK530_24200, partial [Anaerolineales bacterium]|nr:hypothetical protein [Anaerolineales bacterium]
LFSGNDDRTISFWDARNGDEPRVISGFSDAVSRIALSEDGKLLAAASDDGWITILGIPSGSDAQTPYNFPATPTPTATLDLVAQLQGQCLAGRAGLTETDALGGRIVLDSAVTLPNGRSNRDSFFLDVATCAASRINQGNEGGFYYAVSPDRTLLAYKNSVFDALDNVLGEELVIKNFKGEKLLSLPWETEWLRLVDWLDNERIIINPYKQQENLAKTYSTLTVLNPFTGERQILNPDFAKMYEYTPFPDWDGWGVTMYDPKLTRVVYFSESSETSVVLWDLKEGKRLATLLSSGYSAPQWSPDGSHFTMESFNLDQRAWELYMVTWDGQVEQLTNLYGDDQTRLSNYSWSPDGQFIAAWISNEITRENNESQLVILDIATRAVKYFDVWIKHGGDTYSGPPQKPIWSPNGKYLVVLDWYMQEHRHVFLVDVANGIFIPLAEDMEPVGWMLAP